MLYSTVMSHMSEALAQSRFHFKNLRKVDQDIPWDKLVSLIRPYYSIANTESNQHNPIPTETMVRIFFLQHCYSMTPLAIEEALFQIEELRSFALIDISKDVIPCERNIESFNQLIKDDNKLKNKLSVYLKDSCPRVKEALIAS